MKEENPTENFGRARQQYSLIPAHSLLITFYGMLTFNSNYDTALHRNMI